MRVLFFFPVVSVMVIAACQSDSVWIVQKMHTHNLNIEQSVAYGQNIEFSIWGTLEDACWEYSHKDSSIDGSEIFYDFYKKKPSDKNLQCAAQVTDVEIAGAYTPLERGTYTFHFSDGDTSYVTATVDVR